MKTCSLFAAIALAALVGGAATAQQPKTQPIKILEDTSFEVKHTIHSIAYSPDGRILAVGTENIHLYDMTGATPKEITILKTRVGFGIHALEFSPDGKLIALGGADHTVQVWDVAGQKEVFKSKVHVGDVRSVAFSPDSKMLASGSDDKTAILWDVAEDGKLSERSVIKAEDKFGSSVKSVLFAQKGKQLVTGCSNGTFRSFAIGPMGVKQSGGFKSKGGFGDVSVRGAPNGLVWAITDHKQVHLVNSAGNEVALLDGHKENVADAAFSPDGKLLASAGHDGTLQIWTLAAKGTRITKERPGKFTSVAFAPGGEGSTGPVLAAGLEDGKVWVLKLGTGAK